MELSEIPKLKMPSKSLIKKIEALEAKHKGMIAAIDPDSGNYFLGKDMINAVEKGRKKYPNAVFYCIRIGYPAVYEHKGGFHKL
ncbi:MAG: hypothetical protein ONB46_08970 [candidate division KSB1 bacterium]|nr:hypothetical protein [candidate division KSB1 bacterium]MDZ7365844.1 hypothetical protein [candidate division KSB1 bacterium]MDZ7403921.1 hypothetical protein [candidate division KSB1 bacterium]